MMTLARTESPSFVADHERLHQLAERTGSTSLPRLLRGEHPFTGEVLDGQTSPADWLSTVLMDTYRSTRDEEAMALLFENVRTPFLRRIHSMLRRRQQGMLAEDVLHEAFLNICRYPNHFRADRPHAFQCWSYLILLNVVRNAGRRSKREPVAGDEAPLEAVAAPRESSSPEVAAVDSEEAPKVERARVLMLGATLQAYDQLRPGDRELLQMVEIDQQPYRELVERLRCTMGVLKVRVFRARKRLRREIDKALKAISAPAGTLRGSRARHS